MSINVCISMHIKSINNNHKCSLHILQAFTELNIKSNYNIYQIVGEGAQVDDAITVLDVRSGRIGSRTSCHLV